VDAGQIEAEAEVVGPLIRAEGDLPEKLEGDQESQIDECDGDKITPMGPAARTRIKAKRSEHRRQ
jgi:hypothetical protein